MAKDKEFLIKIGGIKESIDNISTLEDALSSIEKQVNEINKNGGFSVASKESNKAMDELAKLTQKLSDYDVEFQKAVEASKSAIRDKNKEVKDEIELEKANITVQEGAQSTYAEKQQLLSALGKVIKNTNADTEEEIARQNELKAQYAALNQELKDFDASLGNHQRNVGDYAQATTNLKQELRELQVEMGTMLANGVDKADPAFVALAEKAGKMKDAMGDAAEEVKRFASDTKALDDVINLAQSATSAFQLYKGAMSAFGLETQAAEEAIQQLAGAMSIIQSLQTLSETLQTGSATAKLFSGTMKVLGIDTLKQEAASIKATVAQQGLTVAQKAGAIASKTFSMALKAIPLMLVIGLITELVLHWEDLVGWVNKTFPALKQMGGFMNTLKAVFKGFGQAIVNWVTNPIKTMADVLKKLFSGDFEGALKAATDGLKNQFKGTAEAFNNGFVKQVKKGQEEMTKKTIEESNKRTQQELQELKIQERNNKTYSKKYIDLQKKDFEERKKLAKGNKDELNKIRLEEMQFDADVQDKITQNRQKHGSRRVKNTSSATNDAIKAEEEYAKRVERIEKAVEDARKGAYDAEYNAKIIMQKINIEEAKKEEERYKRGPIEEYVDAIQKLSEEEMELFKIESLAKAQNNYNDFIEKNKEIFDDFKDYVKSSEEVTMGLIEELYKEYGKHFVEHIDFDAFDKYLKQLGGKWEKFYDTQGLKGDELVQKEKENLAIRMNLYSSFIRTSVESAIEATQMNYGKDEKYLTKIVGVYENIISDLKKTIDKDFNNADKNAPDGISPITRIFSPKKAKKSIESYKLYWKQALALTDANIKNIEKQYYEYLFTVKEAYGKDSEEYAEAEREKNEILKKYLKERKELQEKANPDKGNKNAPKSRNGNPMTTDAGETNWEALWDNEAELYKNLESVFSTLDEMVLAPAMDAFSMYMDFAIEETAQKLEQVEELHDKALDKVNESADKIKELNDSLKDSSSENLDATKQQLADEQMLYAQRLAEERKLAEEERTLKNRQAQQEANARKMELRYQLVMGVANTAQGASKALADWGWPLGAVFAGIMTALGLVQTALIAKQIGQIKPVKYASGGLLSGPSHANGGIPIGNTGVEVEGGEMVVSKKNTTKYIDVLERINRDDPSVRYLRGGKLQNADSRIRKFANGGQLNFQTADENLRANNESKRLVEAINGIDMQPVVSVVDFWKAENRLVRVRGLSGRNE